MSCRFTNARAIAYCGCFKPQDFLELLEKERKWFALFMRVESPRARSIVLTERTRWLRN